MTDQEYQWMLLAAFLYTSACFYVMLIASKEKK